MNRRRTVTFEIRHHDKRLAGGAFVVSPREAISSFEHDRTNVVIENSLAADGTISMALKMYELQDSQPGVGQKEVLNAGIAMGSESGEREPASVMLGEKHELVFKTEWMA